jgi:hypothetical protein
MTEKNIIETRKLQITENLQNLQKQQIEAHTQLVRIEEQIRANQGALEFADMVVNDIQVEEEEKPVIEVLEKPGKQEVPKKVKPLAGNTPNAK